MTAPTRRSILGTLAALPLVPASSAMAQLAAPPAGGIASMPGHANPRQAPFYAAGDGEADDTNAIQAAINAVRFKPRNKRSGPRSGGVFIPSGIYRITKTILIGDTLGLWFAGASTGGTLFLWDGPPGQPMFLLRDVRDAVLTDFQIKSTPRKPLHTAMKTENARGGYYAPSQNLFQNLLINGTDAPGLRYGFRVAQGTSGDANNDFHEFIRCKVKNYAKAAFTVEHSQSHTNRFYSCSFNGYRRGEAGVRTRHGSFSWFGGGGGGNTVADFDLGAANVTISIINGNIEDSTRLVRTGPPSGAPWPILIQGVRWTAKYLHRDGFMVDVGYPGPLILKNNLFGNTTLPRMPRVRIRSNVKGNSVISQGNVWQGLNAMETGPLHIAGHGAAALNVTVSNELFHDGKRRDTTLFRDGDTAPPIHVSRWFRTQNTAQTEISDFLSGWPSAEITVLVEDENTAFGFSKTGKLRGNMGKPYKAHMGDILKCLYDGKVWRCAITPAQP